MGTDKQLFTGSPKVATVNSTRWTRAAGEPGVGMSRWDRPRRGRI